MLNLRGVGKANSCQIDIAPIGAMDRLAVVEISHWQYGHNDISNLAAELGNKTAQCLREIVIHDEEYGPGSDDSFFRHLRKIGIEGYDGGRIQYCDNYEYTYETWRDGDNYEYYVDEVLDIHNGECEWGEDPITCIKRLNRPEITVKYMIGEICHYACLLYTSPSPRD